MGNFNVEIHSELRDHPLHRPRPLPSLPRVYPFPPQRLVLSVSLVANSQTSPLR
jgi:hypothetical protein